MKKKNLLLSAAITGLVLGANVQSASASGSSDKEKCKGVAAKGANSCGANGHGCGGFATKDFDANEWVYVKKGTCAKIKEALKDSTVKEFIKNTTENARKYKDNFKG